MATATVKIAGFQYEPATIEVEVGQPVVWENADAMAHTATRTLAPAFDTGSIPQGGTSNPVTFAQPTASEGIEYFCRPHPFMKGWLIVKPAKDSA